MYICKFDTRETKHRTINNAIVSLLQVKLWFTKCVQLDVQIAMTYFCRLGHILHYI